MLGTQDGRVPQVVVEVDPSLRALLPRRDRRRLVVREAAPSETVAHLLNVVGVPATEVEVASLDGARIEHTQLRTTRIGSSSALRAEARRRPQPNSGRFLLDVHLGTLARRMRLLGFDTEYEADADDSALAARSAAERRELLTRDVGLLFRSVVHDGALIRSDEVDAQLGEVLDRFAPRLSPWTRCLRCNSPLAEVPAVEVAARLEAGTRSTYNTFSRCTGCGQVYWRGAHGGRLESLVDDARRRLRSPGGP